MENFPIAGKVYEKRMPGKLSEDNSLLADHRLLTRALTNRWPISDETKRNAMFAIERILKLPMDNPHNLRLQSQAIKNLALLDSLNVKMITAMMPKHIVHHNPTEMSDEELDAAIVQIKKELTGV